MSPHHSDQMSEMYNAHKIVFWMSISKVLSESVSESVSQWQGHLLSCSGQLKITIKLFLNVVHISFESIKESKWLSPRWLMNHLEAPPAGCDRAPHSVPQIFLNFTRTNFPQTPNKIYINQAHFVFFSLNNLSCSVTSDLAEFFYIGHIYLAECFWRECLAVSRGSL